MGKTKKQLHEEIRHDFMQRVIHQFVENEGEEVLRVKSNEIAIPTLDSEGNEEFIVITFKVPTGSREDGEAYDGYGEAQKYADDKAKKDAKAKEDAEKKARKIAKDKAQREAKAKAKAEHLAEKGKS
jgi:hypothetical protein